MAEEEINNVEIEEEEDEYLPFAKAEVVRLMHQKNQPRKRKNLITLKCY